MTTTTTTPVLIVGGGPVGLCLALFLDYWGVPSTIVNTGETARIHPKGNGQNSRTMEHYRQLGFSDEVRDLGLPHDHPFDQAFYTRFSSHEIFRYKCQSWNERKERRRTAPMTDQFVEPMYHVNQMYVEQFLFKKVKASNNIKTYFGWEGDSFTQDDNHVVFHATKADKSSSDRLEITTKYLIDCSGGRSSIRRTLGIEYVGDVQTKDAFMAGQFYNIWFRIPELYPKYLGHRRAWMSYAINADKETRGIFIALNGKDEFEMILKGKDSEQDFDMEHVRSMIKKAIGDDLEVEILHLAPWTAGAALAVEKYRDGRVFLAGDAAHLFTPVGAFGMNTGIDDAHNLAWKLAATLQGWGGPGLLDSYETERRPIGFKNTGASRKFSTQWQDPEIPAEAEEDSPAGAEARRNMATMSYIAQNHFCVPEDEDCTGVQLGARYDGSPLIIPDGKPPEDKFPETYSKYHPSGVPGGRLPHLWLDAKREVGSSLFDRLGKGYTLVKVGGCAIDTRRLEKAAEARGVPFETLTVEMPEAKDMYECALVLVRPDQYIAWRGDSLPEDCEALLDQISGH